MTHDLPSVRWMYADMMEISEIVAVGVIGYFRGIIQNLISIGTSATIGFYPSDAKSKATRFWSWVAFDLDADVYHLVKSDRKLAIGRIPIPSRHRW